MKKTEPIVVFSLGLVLLAIFTFADLPISMALYGKTAFGILFEAIGELPFTFLALFSAVLLFRFRTRRNKVLSLLAAVGSLLLILLLTYMGGFMTIHYLTDSLNVELPALLSLPIAAILLLLAVFAARRIPAARAHEALSFAILTVVYFVAIIVVMNVLKGVWGRMRMREMTDPAVQFTPWYVITPRGGFDNRYASFPSGHAMNAAAVLLVALLPTFVEGLAGKGLPLRIAAYAWMVVVGFSRIGMGAHFASDVTVGILLSLLLLALLNTLVYRLRKRPAASAAATASLN